LSSVTYPYFNSTLLACSKIQSKDSLWPDLTSLLQNELGSKQDSANNVVRYDTIAEFHMDSKAECIQLNLAHVARKKEETKTNKRQ